MEHNSNSTLNTFWSFFKHPAVGILGSLAGIIGIPLAIYFYTQTALYPDLVYYVNPARAAVVQQGAASHLTVSIDGQQITTDVSAAQVAIWNRGKQAIRHESVLEPIVIR